MYLNRKSVLYIVNADTIFRANQFLNNMSIKKTQKTLQQCWINIYLDSLNIIGHNIETNFDFTKFQAKAKMLNIIYYLISIKTYQLIEKVEKYHILIYRTYDII